MSASVSCHSTTTLLGQSSWLKPGNPVAGSVDEQANEQGIAHMVEHITFLGSKKRESLLGTGARSNAYTDFHHTVFHVHAPLVNGTTGQAMLPQVLIHPMHPLALYCVETMIGNAPTSSQIE